MQRELPLHTSGRHVDDLDVAAGGADGADRHELVPVLEGERRTHPEDEGWQSQAGQNTGSGNFNSGRIDIFEAGNRIFSKVLKLSLTRGIVNNRRNHQIEHPAAAAAMLLIRSVKYLGSNVLENFQCNSATLCQTQQIR